MTSPLPEITVTGTIMAHDAKGERSIPPHPTAAGLISWRGNGERRARRHGLRASNYLCVFWFELLRRRIDLAFRKPVARIGNERGLVVFFPYPIGFMRLAVLYLCQRLRAFPFLVRIMRLILGQDAPLPVREKNSLGKKTRPIPVRFQTNEDTDR
ncbi:MAG: hypothetical protein QM684_25940 [Rhizobium sp.]